MTYYVPQNVFSTGLTYLSTFFEGDLTTKRCLRPNSVVTLATMYMPSYHSVSRKWSIFWQLWNAPDTHTLEDASGFKFDQPWNNCMIPWGECVASILLTILGSSDLDQVYCHLAGRVGWTEQKLSGLAYLVQVPLPPL